MKTIKIILIGMLCAFFITCSNHNANRLKSGQIEIKAYPDEDKTISFYAAAQKITIDWGDGSKDEFTPDGIEKLFRHEYPNQNFQTVLIETESITEISIIYRNCHELRFGKCPALTGLSCYDNQLTSLDVSKCTALTGLNCYYNQLSASALDSLFNSLPPVENGGLIILDNPGADSCDNSIATNKGWYIW